MVSANRFARRAGARVNPQSDAIDAQFSVSWTHRYRCTSNAFALKSPLTELIDNLKPIQLLVVIDQGLHNANQRLLPSVESWQESLKCEKRKPILVAGGEEAKNNDQVVNLVFEAINNNKLCRKSCVLVIGGGAVLDAVGYATSLAHRGINLIRMPTTTLSACDSGVAVKNGINRFGKKNFVGVFDPPYAVVNDLSLLSTLDDRHWRSGISEAIKVALVKDEPFFNYIESNAEELVDREVETMANVVATSAKLHLRHITEGGDPFERLEARPLDFGHWAAHKLEQLTNYELTHGEAVSIGLAIDLKCSVILEHLDEAVASRAITLLQAVGLPTSNLAIKDPALLDGIEEFREHLGGELTLLMLKSIGQPIDVHSLSNEIVQQAISELV